MGGFSLTRHSVVDRLIKTRFAKALPDRKRESPCARPAANAALAVAVLRSPACRTSRTFHRDVRRGLVPLDWERAGEVEMKGEFGECR
jgi:hypothetical protein